MRKYIVLLLLICITCEHNTSTTNDVILQLQDLHASTDRCMVTYNPNGALGYPPVDTHNYHINDTVTVIDNTHLYKEDYYFIGWCTTNDCSGCIYKPGSTFSITSSIMLYACFKNQDVYSITYFPGDADSGTPPLDTNLYTTGEAVYLKPNTGNLVKAGYNFNGWEDSSHTCYKPGETIYVTNQNIELVASFTQKPLTITYHANGATTGTIPFDELHYNQGELATIAHNTGNLAIINVNGISYCFGFWNDMPDSSGTMYIPGHEYTLYESLHLYACYRPYCIGDTGPTGGYVFYDKGEYSDGWRYLEAMKTDVVAQGIVWEQQLQPGQYRTTDATGVEIGTGNTNCSKIVAVLGDGNYAALLCIQGGMYGGWFLPSKNELALLYQYKSAIGNFTGYNYWSSSEYTSSRAWCQNFSTGTQSTQYKSSTYRIRAIRQF